MSENPSGGPNRSGRSGEEMLGKLAQDLLENPMVSGALSRVFEARERAVQAQEAAMGALNIPSAADMERLTRRVRSLSQRLEGIEDGVDGLDDRLARLAGSSDIETRLTRMESVLDTIAAELSAIRSALPDAQSVPTRSQERLEVPTQD